MKPSLLKRLVKALEQLKSAEPTLYRPCVLRPDGSVLWRPEQRKARNDCRRIDSYHQLNGLPEQVEIKRFLKSTQPQPHELCVLRLDGVAFNLQNWPKLIKHLPEDVERSIADQCVLLSYASLVSLTQTAAKKVRFSAETKFSTSSKPYSLRESPVLYLLAAMFKPSVCSACAGFSSPVTSSSLHVLLARFVNERPQHKMQCLWEAQQRPNGLATPTMTLHLITALCANTPIALDVLLEHERATGEWNVLDAFHITLPVDLADGPVRLCTCHCVFCRERVEEADRHIVEADEDLPACRRCYQRFQEQKATSFWDLYQH